jgi:hypothetical protein
MIFKRATTSALVLIPQDSEAIRLVSEMNSEQPMEFTKKPKKSLASHRAIHALLHWTYHNKIDLTPVKWQGHTVEYLYDRFVYDTLMLAGAYTLSRNLRGEIRPIVVKITYNRLSDKQAHNLYNILLDTIRAKYLKNGMSNDEIEIEFKNWKKE